jgi:beta-glucanase (GH16 family)
MGVVGHCDMGATYPTYNGYTLSLVEDFPAPIDLDTDPIFTWSDGSPEAGQTRFRKEQITFTNGTMVITADSTCKMPAAPCIPDTPSYAECALNQTTGNPGAMNVWSGEFRSKYNNYRYGHYEARFHAPSANPGHETDPATSGNFLSTMFIFRTPKWQTWNEIDIELEPNIPLAMAYNVVDATGQQHYPSGNAAPGNTMNGLPAGYKNIDTHTYAFEWTPSSVTWFVDGAMVNSYTGSGADPIPTKSAKIMMNLWIFGSTAAFGDPANNMYPFSAVYEYFHFYKWNSETTYPCSPTPSCLQASDTAYSRNNPTETNYPN